MKYERKTTNDSYTNWGVTEERVKIILSFAEKHEEFRVWDLFREFRLPINTTRRILTGLFVRRKLHRRRVPVKHHGAHEYIYSLPPSKLPPNPELWLSKRLFAHSYVSGLTMTPSSTKQSESPDTEKFRI